jgi:hypothetical protein
VLSLISRLLASCYSLLCQHFSSPSHSLLPLPPSQCAMASTSSLPLSRWSHSTVNVFDSTLTVVDFGERLLIGAQVATLLKRETFNMYRSMKIKRINIRRANPAEVAFLVKAEAVRVGTHSVTLIPLEKGLYFIAGMFKRSTTTFESVRARFLSLAYHLLSVWCFVLCLIIISVYLLFSRALSCASPFNLSPPSSSCSPRSSLCLVVCFACIFPSLLLERQHSKVIIYFFVLVSSPTHTVHYTMNSRFTPLSSAAPYSNTNELISPLHLSSLLSLCYYSLCSSCSLFLVFVFCLCRSLSLL